MSDESREGVVTARMPIENAVKVMLRVYGRKALLDEIARQERPIEMHDAAGPCEPGYHRAMPDGSRCRCGQIRHTVES